MGSGNGVDKSLDLRLIPEFEGSPQQSVVELLEKVELVCKLRDISDVAGVIPLRLTGGAFAVYLQLNAQERSSIDKVKESLLAAFAADPFVAYDQFVSRKLGPHESHDVFLAELRRLATLFGGVSEEALACAFVAGLPENGPGVRSPTAPPGQRCFECGGPNHFARDCLARRQDGDPEKRARDRGISASLLSPRPLTEALPAVRMNVGGIRRRVLVDTGCSVCVAHASCCRSWREEDVAITTMCGRAMRCEGTGVVQLRPHGKPLGYDLILGMNGIAALGGVTVTGGRCVRFGLDDPGVCAAAEAEINAGEPGVLRNTVEEYPPVNVARGAYEDELRKWIKDGCLVPYDESEHGPPKGLLLLMAVIQRNKKKVRPVMDFRELNAHIESHTADADVCSQKLREWRRQGVNVALIDLKKTYLQIRIDKSLWPYQTVVFKGKRYCLTRLGFGLNVAPLVMKAVMNCVLSRDPDVRKGTSAYIDDILVNESVVAVDRVKRHLAHYGLTCKTHELAADGARLLGLKVWGKRGKLMWRRDNDVGGVADVVALCFLTAESWLATSRKANDATTSWDEVIDGDKLRGLIQETALAVKKRDPTRGRWDVSAEEAKIWVDSSSLAISVALEVGGSIVEDAAWLRPDDAQHINMAELDAVIKGLNLALS
ncbi:hypothetical protein T03_15204 [Trichinella britovi]|uniref:CCHC-type domain-containing protein n=1 Tax=Trichinella britovi TaxID=45882 RepID=A0A0V1CHI2_TRIBR|nr:hypothetical protein T03_15204 [Trichinella britovi]